MKDHLTVETLLQSLRNAPREPFDPSIDYEPPHNPAWARTAMEYDYVTNARYREWWDRKLADLTAAAKQWKEAGETALWISAQATLERYAALKALVRTGGSE